jgi:hypothetical protein
MAVISICKAIIKYALVASEYAIVIINLMYPKKFDKVKEERELQIELMKNV